MAGRLELFQLKVLGHTFADARHAQLAPRTARDRHRFDRTLHARARKPLNLIEQRQLQVSPLARYFAQPIALLPALQAMRRGIVPPLLVIAWRIVRPRLQFSLEQIEHVRNVIVKLRAWQRIGGRQLRVGIGSGAPRLQYDLPARAQMRRDGIQFFVDVLCASHIGKSGGRWTHHRNRAAL